MLCVPISRTSLIRQSNAATAFLQCGELVRNRCQFLSTNRSAIGTCPAPENKFDRWISVSPSALTQSTLFDLRNSFAALFRLMQTRIVGGESDTVQKAEHVTPANPCGPPVVTIVTVEANFESASRNSIGDTRPEPPTTLPAVSRSGISRTPKKFTGGEFTTNLIFAEATSSCRFGRRSICKCMHEHSAVLIFKSIW
jgi:hypothetical protein